MIRILRDIGFHAIGMVKSNYRYSYNGQVMKLDAIREYLPSGNNSDIIGSLCCETRDEGIPVKRVHIRNRNKRSE